MKPTRILCLLLLIDGTAVADVREQQDLVAAASRVAPGIVRIDRIASQGAAGDLLEGSPTTGTLISAQGHVLTSRLSIAGNPSGLLVTTNNGSRYSAKVIAEDLPRELALLQIVATELKGVEPLTLQEQGAIPQGLGVVAVGCPIDNDSVMLSMGIISGSGRLWGKALQTDARITLAQLGGPLVNRQGEVIGILIPAAGDESAGEDGTDWYDSGVSMAVPTNEILKRIERMREGISIKGGLLGISWGPMFVNGTEIKGVFPGSPAAKSGLRRGDQVIAVDGRFVARMDQVRQWLGGRDAGDEVSITVKRQGNERTIKAELVDQLPPFQPRVVGLWGSKVEAGLKIDAILDNSAAAKSGLAVGDIIVSAAQEKVLEPSDLALAINMVGPMETLELTLADQRSVLLQPTPIQGAIPSQLPAMESQSTPWDWRDLVIPELPNRVRIWSPEMDLDQRSLGLLVIAGPLAGSKLEEAVQNWIAEAAVQGVVVAVIGPRDEARWEMDEIEVLARVARQVARRWKIDPRRIATGGIGPGGSLAVVAAMVGRETFRGVAIVEGTKLPRFRLRANDPAETISIFWLGDDSQSTVAKGLRRAGYGIWTEPNLTVKKKEGEDTSVLSTVEGGQSLLRWNRFMGMF